MTVIKIRSSRVRGCCVSVGCAVVAIALGGCVSGSSSRTTVSSYDLERQSQEARYQRMLYSARLQERERYLQLADAVRAQPQGAYGGYATSYFNNHAGSPLLDKASRYAQQADAVMVSGPFGEFGGPTENRIRFYAMMGCSELPGARRSGAASTQGTSATGLAIAGAHGDPGEVGQSSPPLGLGRTAVATVVVPDPGAASGRIGLSPSLESMYIRDLAQTGTSDAVFQSALVPLSSSPVFISGPGGRAIAQAVGSTTYISGPSGSSTMQRIGNSTYISSPSGPSTAQTIGNTTYISGPNGRTTAQTIGSTTFISGPGGRSTAQTIGNTTYISGPNGRTTIQRTGVASGGTGTSGRR
jgi:hypothetical protein